MMARRMRKYAEKLGNNDKIQMTKLKCQMKYKIQKKMNDLVKPREKNRICFEFQCLILISHL